VTMLASRKPAAVRPVKACRAHQGLGFGYRGDNAGGEGAGEDGGEVDERYGHACEVAELFGGGRDGVAGGFEAEGNDEEVEVGDDRQHDAGGGDGQREAKDATSDLGDRLGGNSVGGAARARVALALPP
jgi:hypothetical protein